MGPVDPAELLGARMHVHEGLLRARNVEQRVALRGQFAHAAADQHHQIGRLDARQQLGIRTDAEIAGVAGMQRIDHMGAPERGGDRQREALGESLQRGAGRLRPAAAAHEHDRPGRRPQQLLQPAHVGLAGPGLHRRKGRRVLDGHRLDQHVLRQRDHHRAGAAAGGGIEGARDQLRDAGRIVDLGRPFGDGAEHRPVIELLEGLALAHVARDLPDEQDHRGRILARHMQPGRRIGGAGAAGDEADAGRPGRLADRLRHHGGAALLPADRHRDGPVVQGIERRDIALARHAEDVAHAVQHELIDQHLGGGSGAVIGAHGFPCYWHRPPGGGRPRPPSFGFARHGQ